MKHRKRNTIKCLVCLEKSKRLIEIFSFKGRKIKISDMISLHLFMKCNETDSICTPCCTILRKFNTFYNKVTKSHATLEQHSVKIKLEKDIDINEFEIDEQPNPPLEEVDVKNEDVFDIENNLKSFLEESLCDYETPKDDSVDVLSNNNDTNIDQKPSTSVNVIKSEVMPDLDNESNEDFSNDDDSDFNPTEEDDSIKKKVKKNNESSSSESSSEDHNETENDDSKRVKKKVYIFDRKGRREEEDEIHSVVKIKCDICQAEFGSFRGCKTHFHKVHNVEGYLMCCKMKFFRKSTLLKHVYSEHLYPNGFKCVMCEKILLNKRTLKSHMETHANKNERQHKCDQCSKTFVRSDSLRLHKISHADKTHACDKCSKAYATQKLLNKHIKAVHDRAFSHICDICARVFRNRAICEKHKILVHSDEKLPPAQCQVCGQWLKHEGSLKAHIKRHHEQEGVKHICEICGKESPNSTALYMHKKYVHWTERIYRCQICEKAFKEEKTLKEHMAAHTGDLLYSCEFCTKKCNSSASMHKHRKQMHPIEWEEEQKRKSYV